MDWLDRFLEQTKRLAFKARPVAERLSDRAVQEAKQVIDLDRWISATTFQERLQAISWPRASVAGSALAALVAGVWLVAQPHGMRAHAPPLPTEQQIQARIEAAAALEAGLPPSLAKANETVREETAR